MMLDGLAAQDVVERLGVTRVAIEVFNTPGRLASCYKFTPDGARALQWAMQEANWHDEEEAGWN